MTRAELLAAAMKLLRRYHDETPLGHQPHMIAHQATDLLAAYDALPPIDSAEGYSKAIGGEVTAEDVRDAERYRWLRWQRLVHREKVATLSAPSLDEYIDKALAEDRHG